MSTSSWLEMEKGCLTDDLDRMSALARDPIVSDAFPQLVELKAVGEKEAEEFGERFQDLCEHIKSEIEQLTKAEIDEKKRGHALGAMSSLAVLDSEVTSLISGVEALQQLTGPVAQRVAAVSNWLTRLKRALQRISARLWQLISHLLTPKSWTVQGDVGVGLFGLKGNVGISITFGS